MEPPAMKLIMVRGPRSGETIEFKPGSKIRIGRIVRGNDVTIKDEGISSKHLIIESVSGKWTIRDLDSCNGTFLNSTTLPPNTPFDLRENDTIKLGDCTTISVQMITMDSQDESVAKPKRNPKRQANVPGTSSVRATRGRTKAEAEPVETLGLEGGQIEDQSKITKKGRERSKDLQEIPLDGGKVKIESEENLEPLEVLGVQVYCKENFRPGKETSKKCQVQVDGKEKTYVTLTAGVRVTRSRMNALNLGCDRGEMAATESKITRKGRGRKKKLQEMPPQSSEVETEGKERLVPEEVSKTCEVQADGNENLKSEEVAKEGDAKETRDKVDDTVDNGVQEQKVDLAKMTLGEWFDYVEVYLRKQILNTTEEMIKEMKNKAERVHKYMIEEKKKKMDKL
ncbi:hypothetical protein CUMW_143410 [Citrus unshiu]|uniref:FHA domain-containing protein At4g14490-like n=1 Tax=Citrus sinensis TaxID=2711 RepID=UPI000CAF1C91|nr:FHA domain-containing protein At4g14490-like [Citrus sinensis]GAY52638.1 hypothetical protein CUMW_143410 [Citrus unshiu]